MGAPQMPQVSFASLLIAKAEVPQTPKDVAASSSAFLRTRLHPGWGRAWVGGPDPLPGIYFCGSYPRTAFLVKGNCAHVSWAAWSWPV